ncbi:hypothetical protein J2S19_002994 [Metabacillus malikii]|uniref:Uncharacterized protein n=1 Tax=Metabacillus malikii TaxID=1504265 RepID=A0ABT9ZKF8_9BACI|nr:hypothetical protein [Metabacillus malikii]
MVTIGSKVYYRNEIYRIIYIYNTGMCEIQKEDATYKVELVQITEVSER